MKRKPNLLKSKVSDCVERNKQERLLLKQVKDTILRENNITAGNLNDYANLAVRLNTKDGDKLQEFIDENLENGQKYKVVISTDEDVNADFTFEDGNGLNAHFYKA